MPITNISIPTFAADLVSLGVLLATIESNRATGFDDIINDCFKLKPSNDCDTLRLHDFTDYQELEVVDLDTLTINVRFVKNGTCSDDLICEKIIQPNITTSFEMLESDGVYCAIVTIDYIRDELGVLVPYTKTVHVSFRKDCCDKMFLELAKDMWSKMASIACSIIKFSKVGRKISNLKSSYLKISNLMWVYDNSVDSCSERDQIFCLYNKIK